MLCTHGIASLFLSLAVSFTSYTSLVDCLTCSMCSRISLSLSLFVSVSFGKMQQSVLFITSSWSSLVSCERPHHLHDISTIGVTLLLVSNCSSLHPSLSLLHLHPSLFSSMLFALLSFCCFWSLFLCIMHLQHHIYSSLAVSSLGKWRFTRFPLL